MPPPTQPRKKPHLGEKTSFKMPAYLKKKHFQNKVDEIGEETKLLVLVGLDGFFGSLTIKLFMRPPPALYPQHENPAYGAGYCQIS